MGFEEILRDLVLHRHVNLQHQGGGRRRLRGNDWETRHRCHCKVGTTHKDKVIRFQEVCASFESNIVSRGDMLAQVIGQRRNESVMHIRP